MVARLVVYIALFLCSSAVEASPSICQDASCLPALLKRLPFQTTKYQSGLHSKVHHPPQKISPHHKKHKPSKHHRPGLPIKSRKHKKHKMSASKDEPSNLNATSPGSILARTSLFHGVPVAPLTHLPKNVEEGWGRAHAPLAGIRPISRKTAASLRWSVALGPTTEWSNESRNALFGPDLAQYVPDGHTSSVPSMRDPGSWRIFFSLGESYTAKAPHTFNVLSMPQAAADNCTDRAQEMPFLRNETNAGAGGFWLMGVSRLSTGGYVGFMHQETYWADVIPSPAWWQIRVAYSADEGVTWAIGDTILSSGPRPSDPQWGGVGNQGVIWDPVEQRYICIYGGLSIAMSKDPLARPGTWFKFNGTDFSTPGIDTENHVYSWGMTGYSPAIHFNTYLQKWIMIYQSGDYDLWITSSTDVVHWEPPYMLLNKTSYDPSGNILLAYPTVTSELGDQVSGKHTTLTFAAQGDNGHRKCIQMPLTFDISA